MPKFSQKIINSGRNTGYNSQAKEVVLSSVMHHPLESGFTLITKIQKFCHVVYKIKIKYFLQFIPSPDPYPTQQQSIFLSC